MSLPSDLFFLTSAGRSSGTSSDFTLPLSTNLQGTYELVHFSMVNGLYDVVTGENDTIYFTHSIDGALVAVLTAGSYTYATLATELKIQMDVQLALGTGDTMSVAYSTITGKYTFTQSANTFLLSFATNTASSARLVMGFDALDTTTAVAHVSDNVASLALHNIVVIRISQDNNQHVTLPNNAEASFTVPVTVLFGETIHYKKADSYTQYLSFASSISSISVKALAEDGDDLDLNGVDFNFSLRKLY